MKKKTFIIVVVTIVFAGFLGWRFIRPMNIFVVGDRFAWPVNTTQAPAVLGKLSAGDCAACHGEFYAEWRTTMHSQAWTDPYFQADWRFDGAQHACRLCHTPIDRQLPRKVLGYRDTDKWQPITQINADFDARLQHEGVTCVACHYRDGQIVGVFGNTAAPHPVKVLSDPNQVCVRCHVVAGDRWDTFFRLPPCGTVAEISATLGKSAEITASDTRELGCVQCHMPSLRRPLVKNGIVRDTHRHLWRGGHDPAMVRKALSVEFVETKPTQNNKWRFQLTLANTGAAHYVPTGTPDRHLRLALRVLDAGGRVLDEQTHMIKRTVMWRPFIVDLWDSRLARGQPRRYELDVPADSRAVTVEAELSYHLLTEARRLRIGYKNRTPVSYELVRKQLPLRATVKAPGHE